MTRVVLIGAGGHARSVLDAARSAGAVEVVACTDPDPGLAGTDVDGVPVVGGDAALPELLARGVRGALLGLGAVADNGPRARLFDRVAAVGLELPPVVHAAAVVSSHARLGAGAVVLAGAVVGPGATVGRNVIVNTRAVVEHDCAVADHAHLAPGALLAGAVRVGRGAHVGLGAAVLGGLEIGAHAVVGAGAVVVHDVAPGTTVVGVPARAARR